MSAHEHGACLADRCTIRPVAAGPCRGSAPRRTTRARPLATL